MEYIGMIFVGWVAGVATVVLWAFLSLRAKTPPSGQEPSERIGFIQGGR